MVIVNVIQQLDDTRRRLGFPQKELPQFVTPRQIAETARPITVRHHVDELYVFGSMARGEGCADSDIDFIYHLDDDSNPLIDTWALRDDLQEAFGRDIDLVKKEYITVPLNDRLAEIQRVLFVNSITSQPMFRIV